jgi:hypothetical protein
VKPENDAGPLAGGPEEKCFATGNDKARVSVARDFRPRQAGFIHIHVAACRALSEVVVGRRSRSRQSRKAPALTPNEPRQIEEELGEVGGEGAAK